MTKRIKKRLMLAEIILIIASVFIFRGLWLLLDTFPVMHETWTLVTSLVLGLLVTIPAIRYVIKHE